MLRSINEEEIKNSGYIPSKPDSRDYQFGAVAGPPPADMPSWEIGFDCEDKFGKLRDDLQGQSLGCVSFGSTNDIEMTYLAKGIKKNFSQRWIYSQIHGTNGGASPRDAYKLAQKQGLAEDEILPTNPSDHLKEEEIRKDNDITQEVKDNASQHKIDSYYSISPNDWDLVRQAIYENAGCGSGYVGVNSSMGHFIYLKGWTMFEGYKALKYQDSYEPCDKLIINQYGKFYLGHSNTEVRMFEVWTALKSFPVEKKTMLERKKGEERVHLLVNGINYWIKDGTDFENLKSAQPIIINWEDVKVVNELSIPWDGEKIIGSQPNKNTILRAITALFKTLFGKKK